MTAGPANAPRFIKSLSYDAENRLSQIAVTNALNQPLWSCAYAYNAAQQITQMTEQAFFTAALAANADRGNVSGGLPAPAAKNNLRLTNYDLRSGEEPVAKIGDRGTVAAASCRLDNGESTKNQDSSATLLNASPPVSSSQFQESPPALYLSSFTYDARDQLTNELILHPASRILHHFSYDHAHNRVAQLCQMSNVQSQMSYSYFPANKLEAISSGAAAADDDHDGLPLDEELRHGTDPATPDTDGDGLSDGDEVNIYNTNPWNADSDGDNMRDSENARPLRPDGGVWFGASNEPWPRHFWLQSTSLPVRAAPTNAASHLYYYDLAGNLVSSVVNGAWTHFYYNAQNKLSKIAGSGFTYEFMYDSRHRRVGIRKDGGEWRWDIHDGHVCIAQAENGTIKKFFVRGLGIAEGTGDVIAELQDAGYRMQDGAVTTEARGDLRFTNYDLPFGAEGTTKTRRHEDDLRFTNYDLRFGEGTVAAIADRGNVEAASCRLRSQDGSSTVEAASCRLRSQDGSSTLIVHFYIANHRGDTVLVIGESGAAESHLQYDAFGNVVAKSGSFTPSYTFSTKEHLPGASLYAYAYRVYDPHAGRWTQRDPIDYQDSVNLYQFCGNNPALEFDVDGRFVFGRMAALTGHTQMSGAERDYYLAMTEVTRNVEVTAVSTFYVAAATPLVYSTGAAGVMAAKNAVTSYMLAGPGVMRVFYSGYPVAYEHAVRSCQSVGNAVTLNMTRAGGILTRMQVILGKDMTKPLWRIASAWYANSASGIVPVYLSSTKFTSVSVFYEVEYPILKTIENVQLQFMVVQ